MVAVAMRGCTLGFAVLFLWGSNADCLADPVRIAHNNPFPPFSELRNGKSEGC